MTRTREQAAPARRKRSVLLLSPPNAFLENRSVPRLALLYLGTAIRRDGHEIVIRHLRSLEELGPLAERAWDLVGISATTREYPDAVQVLNHFKRRGHPARIALGGPHATALPGEALRNGFDVVVTGEADRRIVPLVRDVPAGQTLLRCEPVEDLNALPYPDHSLLDEPDSWRPSLCQGQRPGLRIATMILSRGCPYACRFCGPHEHYRRRSDENVADELSLLRQNGYDGLILLDDLPFRHERDVHAFCERTERLGMAFRTNFRADLFTERIAARLVAAGCRRVQFGVESPSQAILDGVDKGTLVDENARAVTICRNLGLEVKAMFVWGLPGDDEASARQLVSWVARYRPDAVQVAMFCPLPGSPLWQAGYGARVTDYRRLTFFRGSNSQQPLGVANDRLSARRLMELYDWILSECRPFTRIDRGLPHEASPQEKRHARI